MIAGRYDVHCEGVMEITKAQAVLLLVVNGDNGSGFSVATLDPLLLVRIPAMLRELANEIEAQGRNSGIEVYVKEAVPRDGR